MPGFFEYLADARAKGPLLAAWVTEGDAIGARALLAREGDACALLCRDPSFPDALAEALCASAPPRPEGGVFLEEISGEKQLVVCGAGHVALCLIRLGAMLGFEVTAIEDREVYAEKARAAGARNVLCTAFAQALEGIPDDPRAAFVVMTREHAHDVECLRVILRKPWAYAGMMGSHSRSAQVRQALLAEGFDPGRVERLSMPIGIPIGARTPEEIAVSVAAELISVLNADGGEGFPPGMLAALTDIERGQAPGGVLALIVEKRGEAPRSPGAKLLLLSDGRALGTVGGGIAEAEILAAARRMLRDGCPQSQVLRIGMRKGGVQCGGEIAVLLRLFFSPLPEAGA